MDCQAPKGGEIARSQSQVVPAAIVKVWSRT